LEKCLSFALVGFGIFQAILYLLFVRAVDLYEREPLRYVVPVFVWGFTVAVGISLVFNTLASMTLSAMAGAQTANLITAVVVAPVVEESAKGLALIIIFAIAYSLSRRRGEVEFSGVMDGIVYGSAVGFGFAIAEDLLYYAQFGAETFVVRRVFGGFAHAAFTSLTGIGIGLITWVRYGALKVILPILGLLAAMTLHSLFNLTATLFGPLAYVVMFLVLLIYAGLIIAWLAVERRTIRTELRDEVRDGTISPEEYEILPTYFRRTGYYLGLLFSGRLSTWSRAHRLHRAAVDLAFTKRLTRNSHAAPQDIRAQRLRGRIRETRAIASPAKP
jgi:RsiW-degrading membrane proteinase PrsW (M82 family)